MGIYGHTWDKYRIDLNEGFFDKFKKEKKSDSKEEYDKEILEKCKDESKIVFDILKKNLKTMDNNAKYKKSLQNCVNDESIDFDDKDLKNIKSLADGKIFEQRITDDNKYLYTCYDIEWMSQDVFFMVDKYIEEAIKNTKADSKFKKLETVDTFRLIDDTAAIQLWCKLF